MKTLSKNELDLAKQFSTNDDLSNDVAYANSMSSSIDDFITNSKKLTGEAWDIEKNKIAELNKKLHKQTLIAKELSDAIKKAINKLLTAIAPDETVNIDEKSIEEIKNQISICKREIISLKGSLNSYITVTKEGGITKRLPLKEGNPTRYAELSTKLGNQDKLLTELERMQQKMQDLKVVAEEVKKELDQTFSDIQKFWNDDKATTLV